MTATVTIKDIKSNGKVISSRFSGKGFFQTYTYAGTQIIPVETQKNGVQWMPVSLFRELSTQINASGGICRETFTQKDKYSKKIITLVKFDASRLQDLKEGTYFMIGSKNAEFIRMTIKDGKFSYISSDTMSFEGKRKTVSNRSLKQIQKKKISWLVSFE